MEVHMKRTTYTRILSLTAAGILVATVAGAFDLDDRGECLAVGGSVHTNLGVIPGSTTFGTTLGTATGDLKGAAAATILDVTTGADGLTVFTVQHHWVTESGDTIILDVATASARMVAPGLFAIVKYRLAIAGGTGRFKGATGHLDSIGEVDLNAGRTVFRYTGRVCFSGHDAQ